MGSWLCLEPDSPAALATPVPSQADLAGPKRRDCNSYGCRIAENVWTLSYSFSSLIISGGQPSDTDTTSQSVVNVLINALPTYQAQDTSLNSNATVWFDLSRNIYSILEPPNLNDPFPRFFLKAGILSNLVLDYAFPEYFFILIYTPTSSHPLGILLKGRELLLVHCADSFITL